MQQPYLCYWEGSVIASVFRCLIILLLTGITGTYLIPSATLIQAYPQEKVGVFVRRGKGGPLTVVEYSELDQSLASAINQQTGRLHFCWSNVKSLVPTCILIALLLR